MATHANSSWHIDPIWDSSFRALEYVNEEFNDPATVAEWLVQGYFDRFTGDMCDMRRAQPTWNSHIVDIFHARGWRDIGTSYYRMGTGTVLPAHRDLYLRYINLFNLRGLEHTIWRAIVYLEDWQPGHYTELAGAPFSCWRAGDVLEWQYDTPHLAANLGTTPRYTLQVTGHRDP